METTPESTTETYLSDLQWRYATKKFDSSKKLTDAQLSDLLDAIRLSASSYGLQPYEVFVISDPEVREKMRPACWNQPQITDASHVIVFASCSDFDETLVDNYLENVSETRGIPQADLKGYGDFMKSKLVPLSKEVKAQWTSRQAYIALGNLLSAAAAMKIDTCPMEGFEKDQLDEILGLPEKGLQTAVIATVGYRSEEDETQHYPKVRTPKEKLFTHI